MDRKKSVSDGLVSHLWELVDYLTPLSEHIPTCCERREADPGPIGIDQLPGTISPV